MSLKSLLATALSTAIATSIGLADTSPIRGHFVQIGSYSRSSGETTYSNLWDEVNCFSGGNASSASSGGAISDSEGEGVTTSVSSGEVSPGVNGNHSKIELTACAEADVVGEDQISIGSYAKTFSCDEYTQDVDNVFQILDDGDNVPENVCLAGHVLIELGGLGSTMAAGQSRVESHGPGFDIDLTFTTSAWGTTVDGSISWTNQSGNHSYVFENEELESINLDLEVSVTRPEGAFFDVYYFVSTAGTSAGGSMPSSASAYAMLGIDLTAIAP